MAENIHSANELESVMPRSSDWAQMLNNSNVSEAAKRGLIEIKGDRITYT